MILLKAKPIIEELKNQLLEERRLFSKKIGLASLKIVSNEATSTYISSQKRWADILEIDYHLIEFDQNVSLEHVVKTIEKLNEDHLIKGIILHKPFPSGWDESTIFERIDIKKDVEGLNPYNLGMVFGKVPLFLPPTVLSVMMLLKVTNINLYGKDVLIVGFSNILGKPLSIILADKLATVSIAHIGTFDAGRLASYVKGADVLISAVGKPNLIKGEWIKKGAVVIDVGISKVGSRLIGDVEFEKASKRASFITPVPGGVGSLTVVFLFKNLLEAAKMQIRKDDK